MAKARLINLVDGCALTLTVSHALIDGRRYIELLRDLGRLYRGEAVLKRDHNRSHLWPDQLAKHFTFLEDEIAKPPRDMSQPEEKFTIRRTPVEPCSLEALYFPKEVLAEMKATANSFVPKGEFVSTNDVLFAFMWMLKCELKGKKDAATDGDALEVSNSTAACLLELLANGVDVIPDDFVGNGFVFQFLSIEDAKGEDKSLKRTLATLALMLRRQIKAYRQQKEIQAESLLMYYNTFHRGNFPATEDKLAVSLSNLLKMPLRDVDFGNGSAKMTHLATPLPLNSFRALCGPAPGASGGVMIHTRLTKKQANRLTNSKVLQACAPGAKLFYSQVSVGELENMLKS